MMKKFETPIMNVEKFELSSILTTSAVTPADAVETAKAKLNNMGITDENTFTITL